MLDYAIVNNFGGVTCQKEKKDSKCISQEKIGL